METTENIGRKVIAEVNEIGRLIENTPLAGIEDVRRYHETIIKRLDSGEIIEVPSQIHFNLHQLVWIEGHKVYNQFNDGNAATISFLTNGEYKRFNAWYAHKYILGSLPKWEQSRLKEATICAMEVYKHPLEYLTEEEMAL